MTNVENLRDFISFLYKFDSVKYVFYTYNIDQ